MQVNTSLITVGADGSTRKIKPVNDQQQRGAEKQPAPLRPDLVRAPQNAEDLQQASEYQQFIREASDSRNQQAISTYSSLEKQHQREHIQTLFGVDTYA